jgi:hypothetical protein
MFFVELQTNAKWLSTKTPTIALRCYLSGRELLPQMMT